MQKLIDALESLDDVQEVYTSVVMDEACAAASEKDTPLHGKQAGTDQRGAQQMTFFVDQPAARHVARGKSPRRRPPGPGSQS
jgi:hypothetical protein